MAAVGSPRSGSTTSVPPPGARLPTPRPQPMPDIHVGEDGFVAEAVVDGWVRCGAASRTGCSISTHDGRRLLLRDALRVLGRRNGDTDPYGFTGRVEALRDFVRRGASISADALRLGS